MTQADEVPPGEPPPRRRAAEQRPPRRAPRSKWLRSLRHFGEGVALEAALMIFRALPIEPASALGGWLARRLGPRSSRHGIADANIRLAFPEMSAASRAGILRGMWDNLGRSAAELAHLEEIYPSGRVEIVGGEHIESLRDDGVGGIFFSAHFGNWELLSLSLAEYGVAPTMLYRPSNNWRLERALQRRRLAAQPIKARYLPKSSRGVRGLVQALREGAHLAMLIDQKARDGIPVRMFGREATASQAAAQMALRYEVPMVPARIERLGGARFRLTVLPPISRPSTGDAEADAAELTRQITAMFEGWIRERPDHWLWLHRRWT